ncbi:hypothetical protein AAXE64_27165 [Priestia megaterium]|uniref:hypothetical protein n=1 Tax=Priestia megaterium TaxID=1404 RepID=UPI003D066C12
MKKTNKQIRQMGVARRIKQRLEGGQVKNSQLSDKEIFELSEKLSDKEILLIINLLFHEISILLRLGFRVIFEGYASFYTKAIQRTHTDIRTNEQWITRKRRLRWKPAPDMKKVTEIDISEEEYLEEAKDR